MITYNDWMSYSYDGVINGKKIKNSSIFKIHYNNKNALQMSYKDALYRNASLMRELYPEPFDVCFSGGIDSEIVVRVFNDLKIKQNICIFKFENDHNIKDYTNAVNLCNRLNLNYKVIDFKLEKFFENEGITYAEKTKCAKSARLPRFKWIEMLDNVPVFGEGEPYWFRKNKTNSNIKSDWVFEIAENNYSIAIYAREIGKTSLIQWYEFTPEVNRSFYDSIEIKDLLDDKLFGKLSCWSSRVPIHQKIWPDIQYVPKYTGYEGKDRNQGVMPEFMIKFQKEVLSKFSETEYVLTKDEFENVFKTATDSST